MSVVERQKRGGNYKAYSSRLPEDQYRVLVDWAWRRRTTLAAAATLLLGKAIASENGAPYKPEESEGESNAKSPEESGCESQDPY